MPVEIGQLTVSGRFGGGEESEKPELREALARLRRDMIREMREMLDEHERRSRER